MVSLLTRVSQFWAAWALRITSYLSFASHILLTVFARSRRHNTCRWQRRVLWLAYQTAEISATYALGDLSLSGASAAPPPPSRQQQLVAFWAPFLLLHLGGPDNITAYALEDNLLSKRKWFEMCAQVLVVFFALYNYVYLGGSRALLGASIAMATLALAKYAEKACALYQGNLDNMRTTSRDEEEDDDVSSSHHTVLMGLGDLQIPSSSSSSGTTTTGREMMDDEQALLYAHKLFRACCKRAMVDSSVRMADRAIVTSYKIFSLGWQDVVKVVEMELSLMYDVLYTKAGVIHAATTWWCTGYLLRLVSPAATAAAAAMFCTWSYPRHQHHDDGLDPADVRFTYVMLAAAFLLDVLWLARALGSSWMHTFLSVMAHHHPPLELLQHKLVCSGRWRRLHRFVASLDPCRLFGNDPISYRRWSGVTGRYNLLHEATRHRAAAGSGSGRDPVPAATSSRDYLTSLFKCKQDVKRELFERIRQRLPLPALPPPGDGDAYSMVEITTRWGHKAVTRFQSRSEFQELRELDPKFGREFQEDIIAWHIGTCVFLSCTDEGLLVRDDTYDVKAIEVLSEYLMFLVAARPHMLPGLVLRSLFEETFRALAQKWDEIVREGNGPSIGAGRKEKLASVLYEELLNTKDEKDGLMWDGIAVGMELLKVHESYMHQLLELIFDVWVDKLLYASTRCSRESHAKQLSSGGELTTIVWIMVEHAGLFRIGETNDQTSQEPTYINIGDEEKKKKQEEKKKKKEAEERNKKEGIADELPPWHPAPPQHPQPQALSEKARKRRARKTTYATLYPA